MKIPHLVRFAACFTLLGSPILKSLAADSAPAPSAAPATAMKQPKTIDPEKEQWNAAQRKALADPDVKAAMDAARKAQSDANMKMYEKIRETDPSLGAEVDAAEAKLKAREPKPRPVKPDAKAAKKKPAAASPSPAAA